MISSSRADEVGLGNEAGLQSMSGERLQPCPGDAGGSGTGVQQAAHALGMLPARLDGAVPADTAEHRPEVDVGGAQPGVDGAHRADLGPSAAADEAGLVAPGARQQQDERVSSDGKVLDVEADQLAPAQRAGIARQDQGAVAQPVDAGAAGGNNLSDLRRGQRDGLPVQRPGRRRMPRRASRTRASEVSTGRWRRPGRGIALGLVAVSSPAGLEALRLLLQDRRAMDPERFGHLRRELGPDAEPGRAA